MEAASGAEIGLIQRVDDRSPQALFVIEHQGREVLVPVVDDFIEKVDKKNREIRLRLPEGLLDLYKQ